MQFDERFALGLVLNRNRSSSEKIKGGLQASQFQKDSPVGIILMKEQVDRIQELEGQVASLTAARDVAPRPGEVDVLKSQVAGLTAERDDLKKTTEQQAAKIKELEEENAKLKKPQSGQK